MVLIAVTVFAVVGAVALSGGAAAFSINTDFNGNNGNVTSGAADQPIGEIQFTEGSSSSSTTTAVRFPDGVTINESTTAVSVTSNNMSSQSVTIDNSQTLSVTYQSSGENAKLNITGVRVDVDPSVTDNKVQLSAGGENSELNVTSLSVETNATSNLVRGQTGVGPYNVTILPANNESYRVAGPDNKSLIGQDTQVRILIPEDEDRVTFDTDATVTVSSNVSTPAVVNDSEATVNPREISFTTTEGNLSVGEELNVTGIQYDTTGVSDDTVPANFTANLTVETTAETPVSVRSQTANAAGGNAVVNAERPGSSLNKTIQVTSGQANTTAFNVTVQDSTTSKGALGAGSQVEIALPSGGGVTFNTSDSAPPTRAFFNTSDIADRKESGISVSPYTVTVSVNNSTGGASSSANPTLNVTNLTVDSAPGTTNQTIDLRVTTTANKSANSITQNTSVGTSVNTSNIIEVANGNNVNGSVDADGNYGATGNGDAINNSGNLRPGDTVTSAIRVTDKFGGHPEGITIDLNTTENPSSNTVLATDSVVTNETGEAIFDVTLGDTTGTYNVTASLAHNASANVTLQYEAAAGEAAGFSVTGVNNSLTDTSGIGTEARGLEQAAYRVQVVDANNNPVNASVDVNVETSGSLENVTYNVSATDGSPSGQQVNDTDSDGKLNYDATKVTDGNPTEFYVFVSSAQPGDETVTISSEGVSDTGTATVFSSTLDSVDVSIDKTDLTTGDSFNVTAVGTVDGNTVEVSGISTAFSVDDNAVAFLTSENEPDTDTAGQASVAGQALTSGQTQVNVTFNDAALSGDVTGSVTLGAQEDTGTGSPLDGTAGEYDSDGDGQITIQELADAGSAYTDGELTIQELAEVGSAYTDTN